MKPPRTYSEWVDALKVLKEGTDDEGILAALKQGSIEWQSGTAERLSVRIVDTFNDRMNKATDKFQRDYSKSRGDEGAIVRALLALRREMSFLVRAIDLPALPEATRAKYRSLVAEQADIMQRALEDSAKSDRTGKLGSIVRNHKVNRF